MIFDLVFSFSDYKTMFFELLHAKPCRTIMKLPQKAIFREILTTLSRKRLQDPEITLNAVCVSQTRLGSCDYTTPQDPKQEGKAPTGAHPKPKPTQDQARTQPEGQNHTQPSNRPRPPRTPHPKKAPQRSRPPTSRTEQTARNKAEEIKLCKLC